MYEASESQKEKCRDAQKIGINPVNLRIVRGSLQDGSVACTTVLLKVVTECTNPAKIGWVALVLLLDEPQCQGHIPVGLSCEFLNEHNDLCTPPPLGLQAALVSPPLCTPPFSKFSGGKVPPQALSMFCPQLRDGADRPISVVGQPIAISPLPLMGIKPCPAVAFGEGCPDLPARICCRGGIPWHQRERSLIPFMENNNTGRAISNCGLQSQSSSVISWHAGATSSHRLSWWSHGGAHCRRGRDSCKRAS